MKRRPTRRRAKNKTMKRKTVKPSANFSQKVMKVVNRHAETKCANPHILRANDIKGILDDNLTQCVPLMPEIAQGAGQGDRVGNQVSTRRVWLLLQLWMYQVTTPANSDPPKFVDIYIYKYKPSNRQSVIDLRKFLQYGNTAVSYDQDALPESGLLNVNSDVFTLKKHMRRQLWNPNAANTYALANKNVQNALSMKLDITKYFNKTIKYDDTASNVVTNDNLYVSIVLSNNDGQLTGTTTYGEFNSTVLYKFDDL